MIGRLVLPVLIVATLSLQGCIIGDSIAHVVKLAQGEGGSASKAAPAPANPPAAAAPAPHDDAPPPPPAAAPERGSVSVETLAPPAP